ncbi:tRNA-uridine aminocarboxypropyltransferase [Vibrio ziniensis]|uniref:tRNA-uridine aminocarboxypropyltransferase n=1 Tax=Vibrio ziniensis TaxID=2711221 RepID=A0A6G7CLT9_9VIBR|nr:DTW domain-containing protein [Vibrio ziniensis]QIH43044.1 DTW domain-containing protein [Vibrio ziniensis]
MSVNTQSACPNCGLQFQCVCQAIPKLNSPMPLSLLMHENEYVRETNTGKWLLKALPLCQNFKWSRVAKNDALLERIHNRAYQSFLVYPSEESMALDTALKTAKEQGKTAHFIILDGTWQEAKKMERKSPWLDDITRVHLTPSQISNYQLRRNQSEGHLCTLEVASEILALTGDLAEAQQLNDFLIHFSKVYQADKSGHVY